MQCETVEGGLHGNALIAKTARNMWKQGGLRPYYRGLGMGLAGMFPYSALSLTQIPGAVSQGWPGLIYLLFLTAVAWIKPSNG